MTSRTGEFHQLGPGPDRGAIHTNWDRALAPRLTIAPGDTIEIATLEPSWGNVARSAAAGEIGSPEPGLTELAAAHAYPKAPRGAGTELGGHALTGPLAIAGAQPGDTLVVEILSVAPAAWGWTWCGPGNGLLPDDFPDHRQHLWDLRDGRLTPFVTQGGETRAWIPIAPFCGVMGVAPVLPGPHRTAPPGRGGGNMDVRQLTAGATLYLPVQVPDALFSVGDAHAAQGDGEVSGTAIEMDATVTLRFGLRRGEWLPAPAFLAPDAGARPGPVYAVTAHDPNPTTAAQAALRGILRYLSREHGMDEQDACILASTCVDLRLSQVVNAGITTVSALLPLTIFAPPA